MKITQTFYLGEMHVEVELQTRNVETHSRMQSLTEDQVYHYKNAIRLAVNEFLEIIHELPSKKA